MRSTSRWVVAVVAASLVGGACGADAQSASAPTTGVAREATSTTAAGAVASTTTALVLEGTPAPPATSDRTLDAPPADDGGRLCGALDEINQATEGVEGKVEQAQAAADVLRSSVRAAAPGTLRADVDALVQLLDREVELTNKLGLEVAAGSARASATAGDLQAVATALAEVGRGRALGLVDGVPHVRWPNYLAAWMSGSCGPKPLVTADPYSRFDTTSSSL